MLPPNNIIYVFQIACLLEHPNKTIITGETIGPPPIPPAYANPTNDPRIAYEIQVKGSDNDGNSYSIIN